MSLQFGLIVTGVIVLGIIVLGLIMTKMFHRASKELAFVRTGFGGEKVVKDGGAIVLPILHETIPINMQTLRLTVQRGGGEASLITKDRLRVDVRAEFYVRVAPDATAIATAAQTLGRRTMAPDQLAGLVEGKFVDALRAAAASMDMQDLHEKRGDFVQKVQNTVAEDLKKNGLELESVSLTGLDQTDVKFFNPNNAFDAEGLAKLTQVTETRRKERNEIEADNRVAIEQKNFEANKRSLEIKQQNEFATLEQQREVETRRAAQEAELAQTRAERKRESDLAEIEAAKTTEQARVAKERAIKVSETEAAQALEIASQQSRIAVAEKSEQESKARAAADNARAEQVRATEAVKTVEAEASAERAKRVAVIQAEQAAEQEATRIRVMAAAELEAADSQAKAKERLIDADAKRYEVESEGQRALNEAANVVTPAQMAYNLRKALIESMPTIMEKMTKPMEKVDSIRVVQMGGLGGLGGQAGEGAISGTQTTGNLATDLTNSMLGYRLQVPVIDEMARELGVDLSRGLNGLVEAAAAPLNEDGSLEVVGAPAPVRTAPVRKARGSAEAISAQEKAELQKLAGINPDEL
jgi:uncharacterized membrane protein YqiK